MVAHATVLLAGAVVAVAKACGRRKTPTVQSQPQVTSAHSFEWSDRGFGRPTPIDQTGRQYVDQRGNTPRKATSDAQDWATSSSLRFRLPSIESATREIVPGMAGHAGRRPADPQGNHPTVPLRHRVRKARAARARPSGRPRQAPATLLRFDDVRESELCDLGSQNVLSSLEFELDASGLVRVDRN